MATGGGGSGGGSSSGVRAGGAYVELSSRNSGLLKGLADAKNSVASFAGSAAKLGAGALAGAAAGAASFGAAAVSTLGELTKVGDAGAAFGLTAEEASRLFGVMASAGSDTRDATEGLVTLGQRVSDALSGKGEEAKQFFDALGVGADKFAGKNPAQQFDMLMSSLRGVQDPAKRVQLLLKAVGEDTGKNLIPLLSMSEDQVKSLGDQFQRSGSDMAAAKQATLAYQGAVAALGGAWQAAAVAVAPAIKIIADQVKAGVKSARDYIENNPLLQGIKDSLAAGNVRLAAQIAWQAIKVEFTAGATAVLVAFEDFRRAFLAGWDVIGTSVGSKIAAMHVGIAGMLVDLQEATGILSADEAKGQRDALAGEAKDAEANRKAAHQERMVEINREADARMKAILAGGQAATDEAQKELNRLRMEARKAAAGLPGGAAPGGGNVPPAATIAATTVASVVGGFNSRNFGALAGGGVNRLLEKANVLSEQQLEAQKELARLFIYPSLS